MEFWPHLSTYPTWPLTILNWPDFSDYFYYTNFTNYFYFIDYTDYTDNTNNTDYIHYTNYNEYTTILNPPTILITLTTPPTSPSYWLHSTIFTTLTTFTTPTSLNTSISLTRLTTTLTIQNYTGCADWSCSTVQWRHLLRWLHEPHQLRWLHWLHRLQWLHHPHCPSTDYTDYLYYTNYINYFYFTGTSLAVILTTPILPSIFTTLTPSTLPTRPHHWLHSTTKTNLHCKATDPLLLTSLLYTVYTMTVTTQLHWLHRPIAHCAYW